MITSQVTSKVLLVQPGPPTCSADNEAALEKLEEHHARTHAVPGVGGRFLRVVGEGDEEGFKASWWRVEGG